jgi:CRP-like cAMP-binding protein
MLLSTGKTEEKWESLRSCENFDDAADLQNNERCSARAPRFDAVAFRRHIIFATSATTVVALMLILIAFQVQRLRMLTRTISKLDELLELLRDTKHELSPTESKRLQQELTEIRARLLQESSFKRSRP